MNRVTNLTTLYDKTGFSADVGRAEDVVCLDVGKAFNTVSHSLLLDKLARCRQDGRSARWVGNWLTGCAQRVVMDVFYTGLLVWEASPDSVSLGNVVVLPSSCLLY